MELDTPIRCEIVDTPSGVQVRLHTVYEVTQPDGTTVRTPDPLDLLYCDLDAFIETLAAAKRTIEARLVLEGRVVE